MLFSLIAVLVRSFARRLPSASAGVRSVLVATVSSPLCAMATVQAVLLLNAAAVSIPWTTQASQQLVSRRWYGYPLPSSLGRVSFSCFPPLLFLRSQRVYSRGMLSC